MLLNNPQVSLAAGINGSDGTFLHEDPVVTKQIAQTAPATVYAENKELIDAFSQTVVNYSPISINIADFWNKEQLRNIVIPLEDSDFDTIDESKIIYFDKSPEDGDIANSKKIPKAFLINSMIKVQDKLAEIYMNHFYVTANKIKNSHTLRQKMVYQFKAHDIDTDKQNLLFSEMNDLFKSERFLTNKDLNMKKGKKIALEYVTQSASDAKIEGALTSDGFFFNYSTGIPNPLYDALQPYDPINNPERLPTTFEYSVESSILPDVYNAFVKPIAHPLGMLGLYSKMCQNNLTDRVFSKASYTADGISIKCTHPSNNSVLVPPTLLIPWIENPTYDILLPISETNPEYILNKPYDAAVQNTEYIEVNEELKGPWDPYSKTLELFFATDDGYNLWSEIQDMDEGQGNILNDIQYGYGEYEYSGMTYTRYIFQNDAYLIEYECAKPDGSVSRIIEYYRSDTYDTSINVNVTGFNNKLPLGAYPNFSSNMIHGDSPTVSKQYKPYGLDDGTATEGLDIGLFGDGSNNPIRPVDEAYISMSTPVSDVVNILSCPYRLKNTLEAETAGTILMDLSFSSANIIVYINGLMKYTDVWEVTTSSQIKIDGVNEKDFIQVIEKTPGSVYTYQKATAGQTTYEVGTDSNASIYISGKKLLDSEYNISGTSIILGTPLVGTEEVVTVRNSSRVVENYTNTPATPNEYDIPLDSYVNDSGDTVILSPEETLDVFVNGLLQEDSEYTIHISNVATTPGNYMWLEDTNIINADLRFTKIYTLIARFIQTRECVVNVYNLQKTDDSTIKEEFSITTIDYQRNIVHQDYNGLIPISGTDINIINKEVILADYNNPAKKIDVNVFNKYQK